MSENDILCHIDGKGIATVTFNRPERRNAVGFGMLGRFIDLIADLGSNKDVRVVILTGGTEGSFCAGTDLTELVKVSGTDTNLRGASGDKGRWWPLVACPKPVIAAIDGPAVGMGAEFTSQCDVRIATPRARFAWNFVHRGLIPDTGAGTWLLPRILGPQKALELLYSGEFLSAEDALDLGYVSQVVASKDLMAAAQAQAEKFLQGSPFSIAKIKELVIEGLDRSIDDHMAAHTETLKACIASDDHVEGVAAFLEKRDPVFKGT